ncbi:PIN domain-like protein [Multifurca ochricompacta]|uniref:PIN domain-like protein n=1 Tax=Multifurca ochricompacta TaxID=376703 RepID=A0AAD4M467_9AGAM|nr:PIN domain-like protein [Multifurca ochricompacta]
MGVHGLATYLRENQRTLSTPLVLSQEQSESKTSIPLVVDGWSFIYELHNQSRLPWVFGGELGEFYDLVIRVVRAWTAVRLRPYFVFDGPYRPSKFATVTNRMVQSIILPSLLFFRTSSISRSTPLFLRENPILPPLCYAVTLDALRSLNNAVEIYIADDEGDPFAVELAGRLKGYVTSRDSDYVILNAEGYAGYIPMDQMFWSVESQGDKEEIQMQDDAGFVIARKNKIKGHTNEAGQSPQGVIPPGVNGELSLSSIVYTPHTLAAHLQIPISLLPLLAALIGNDFTADRHLISKLFFERDMTVSQRIVRVANVLRSVVAITSGTSAKKKARHQITSVIHFVDLTIESLLVRPLSLRPGERKSIAERTVEAALQYAIPKVKDRDDESNLSASPCVLHDTNSCPLVISFSHSGHPTEHETEARGQVRSLYISAYRRGYLSPNLVDILSTGTAWPELFLENPDAETVSRSLGRPIREWVYALLDDGIGLMGDRINPEGNGLEENGADNGSDDDEIIDVIEEDSDEEKGSGNPLAPLQDALEELSSGVKPHLSTPSLAQASRNVRLKHVIEHIRRGARHAEEPVPVPLLATLLSSHDIDIDNGTVNEPGILYIQLRDEEFRLTVFLCALGSNTQLIKALPLEHLMAAVTLRWIVSRLATRADVAQSSSERERERWTIREGQAFLASFSWPCSRKGVTLAEPSGPPLENRSIQLTAQVLATFDAIEMLSQALLLVHRMHNPASTFSGKAFHQSLASGDTLGTYIPSGLWDVCVEGLEGAFGHEKEEIRKRGRKTKENKEKSSHAYPAHGSRGQSRFDILAGLDEGF